MPSVVIKAFRPRDLKHIFNMIGWEVDYSPVLLWQLCLGIIPLNYLDPKGEVKISINVFNELVFSCGSDFIRIPISTTLHQWITIKVFPSTTDQIGDWFRECSESRIPIAVLSP